MPKVTYGGQSFDCGENSVLECLTAQGVAVPNACRSGVCQTCMMQAVEGKVPKQAQAGIKPTLAAQNYFLACVCHPQEDIKVVLPEDKIARIEAKVSALERLNAEVLGIRLKPVRPFSYKAGQFIKFFKDEATYRCYSLASVPGLDDDLHLNVRKIPGGLVSGWISESLRPGDAVTISEPSGDCFYIPDKIEQDILLVGTGSGLAPLYGIIRDALASGHRGCIKLYHGNHTAAGFYQIEQLRQLEESYSNFRYIPCVSAENAGGIYAQGMVLDVALGENPSLSGWRVFLCGNPDMVNAAKREVFLAGAAINEIYADPF